MQFITTTFITKLKKQAKAERKSSTVTLTRIQDELAREYGYLNWRTMISHKGRGAVLVDDVEAWFRLNYTQSVNHPRIYPATEEPPEIFDLIVYEFDFGLEYEDGGRMAELAENLGLEDSWISDLVLENAARGE
jgi:hypothetical protein